MDALTELILEFAEHPSVPASIGGTTQRGRNGTCPVHLATRQTPALAAARVAGKAPRCAPRVSSDDLRKCPPATHSEPPAVALSPVPRMFIAWASAGAGWSSPSTRRVPHPSPRRPRCTWLARPREVRVYQWASKTRGAASAWSGYQGQGLALTGNQKPGWRADCGRESADTVQPRSAHARELYRPKRAPRLFLRRSARLVQPRYRRRSGLVQDRR